MLTEKSTPFERREIDLADKPSWFLEISPLGKTPVLLVDGMPIFESSVICEYLDDTIKPRLHPDDALQRARHRSWMEFGSALLNDIGAFYSAADETRLATKRDTLAARFEQIEGELGNGPFFSGPNFGIVDAVFGPVFRYFDVFDEIDDFAFLTKTPKVRAWRQQLATRESVRGAVGPAYGEQLLAFLLARNSALSARIVAPRSR